jgi:hypothetical protein
VFSRQTPFRRISNEPISVTKAQQPKKPTFFQNADILQHKSINRTGFRASDVDAWDQSGQQIDKPSLPVGESHFNYDFSTIPGALNSPRPIQAKLKIGAPDDKYEQEADRIAEEVMRMPEPKVQCQSQTEEDDETEEERIQTKLQITPLMQRQINPKERRFNKYPKDAISPVQESYLVKNF